MSSITGTAPARVAFLAGLAALGGCAAAGLPVARDGTYSARIVQFPARTGAPGAAPVAAAVKSPEAATYPVALYLDGSGCRSVVHLMPYLDELARAGFAVVAPEKRGVRVADDGQGCAPEYLEHDTRGERELAARTVMGGLAEALPGWNREMIVVAASEGATIAPALARGLPGLRGLALLGGGGWTQARELVALQDSRLLKGGASERERQEAEAEMLRRMDAIARDPRSDASWLGATNKRWASYLQYDPMPDLLALGAPIYMANGVRDVMTPVDSARAVAAAFAGAGKTNLVAREYPALDHRWLDAEGRSHFAEVGRDLMAWVASLPPVRR